MSCSRKQLCRKVPRIILIKAFIRDSINFYRGIRENRIMLPRFRTQPLGEGLVIMENKHIGIPKKGSDFPIIRIIKVFCNSFTDLPC